MLFAKKLSYLPESAVQAGAGAVATLFHDAVMTPAEGLDTTRAERLKNVYLEKYVPSAHSIFYLLFFSFMYLVMPSEVYQYFSCQAAYADVLFQAQALDFLCQVHIQEQIRMITFI